MEYSLIMLTAAIIILVIIFLYFITRYLSERKTSEAQEIVIKPKDTSVELLKLEFDYAKETSIESQRDRMNILNFYLTFYAGFLTITLSAYQFIEDSDIKNLASLGSLLLSAISIFFILQMVRLRQAWFESVAVMNKIKDYFVRIDSQLAEFLIWRTSTLPKSNKFKTVSYLSTIVISILGSISLGIGLFLLSIPVLLIGLLVILYFVITVAVYHFMLEYNV